MPSDVLANIEDLAEEETIVVVEEDVVADKEPVKDLTLMGDAKPTLEALRLKAKEAGYSYYKNAGEKKLIEVLKAYDDNKN